MTTTPDVPEPLVRGRFSLYETPDGGYHVAWRADGHDEDQHVQVPAVIVRLMRSGGGPLRALRALGGRR